ncbi:hypothetical protein KDM87_05440 [Undibacterium sp. FT147W]|uniref:Crp/Fnr family transcriptional regulator n=1 Tax=Undibacterium rivi TaxID=2828729 RepID=A0ABS5H0W9_9BURK|nr:hypothetical protein [Undibacterium rivi]MBR7792034.1 hypothetical protein [Undibacterium rivi]
MQSSVMNRSERYLLPRQVLTMNELSALWRIESGTVRINSVDESDESKISFVRLALPGDLLGVECFSGLSETLQVRAITPVKLQPVDVADDKAMTALLMKTIATNHIRCRQVVSLRTGTVDERVKRLLHMLKPDTAQVFSEFTSDTLPSLGNMAEIVHSTRETVCRVLTSLREANALNNESRKQMKRAGSAHRLRRMAGELALSH